MPKKKSQNEKVFNYLNKHHKATTLDLFHVAGTLRASARIYDLRHIYHCGISDYVKDGNWVYHMAHNNKKFSEL
jgi:hypothetical protein